MAGSVDDGVVPLLSEELLGRTGDGDTTSTLVLLAVHEESESKRSLAKSLSLGLQLLHFTLGDTTKLEEQTTSGGRLAGVNMTADNDRKMRLSIGGARHDV